MTFGCRVEGDGTVYVGTNNGTVSGAVAAAGVFGRALKFDGVDDYTQFSNSPDFDMNTGDFTIMMAVKAFGGYDNQGSAWNAALGHGELALDADWYGYGYTVAHRMRLSLPGVHVECDAGNLITAGDVYVGTRISNTIRIVRNQVLQTASDTNSADLTGARQFYFGRDASTARYGDITIDEVHIWSKGLSFEDRKRISMGMHPLNG